MLFRFLVGNGITLQGLRIEETEYNNPSNVHFDIHKIDN
jgi:hypothetical protein